MFFHVIRSLENNRK